MRPTIRPLIPEDVAEVVEFSLRAWAPVFESFRKVLGKRIYEGCIPTGQRHRLILSRPSAKTTLQMLWVAEQHGRPVGYVSVRIHDDGTGEIDMLAVDPLVQRQGLGSALTSFAVQRLRAAGVKLAVVGTGGDPGHAPARRTYEKAGFVGLPLVRYYMRLSS